MGRYLVSGSTMVNAEVYATLEAAQARAEAHVKARHETCHVFKIIQKVAPSPDVIITEIE